MFKKVVMIIAVSIFVIIFGLAIVLLAACSGAAFGKGKEVYETEQAINFRGQSSVVNNDLYADRYRNLIDKFLINNGYVSLERIIFYLQQTENILDATTLPVEKWEEAYLNNLDDTKKQMIPIKTLCKELNQKEIIISIESGLNENGKYIEVLDLCHINGVDITSSNDISEDFDYLPFQFPLKSSFVTTSMVFEIRNVELDLTEEQQSSVNFHNGWDFAVPINTEIYSICDGTITNIVMTQDNDLSYNQSKNGVGNYVEVTCSNDLIAVYQHLKYNSVPYMLTKNSIVKKGDLLARSSTTGMSTGPHLHLGLRTKEGLWLDALSYIEFNL